jgi:hypothetical protein
MPVVLVNPSHGRRRKRRNPRRRRNASRRRRVHAYLRRRGNPRVKFGQALLAAGIGLLGGGMAYGVDWGVSYIPVSPLWQSVIFGIGGLGVSAGLAMLADERLACGVAGGVGFGLFGRVREQIALSSLGKGDQPPAALPQGASAVFSEYMRGLHDAARVYREAGQVRGMPGGAELPSRSFRDTGASRYIAGPIRHYGPESWVYRTDAARVFVSAHNAAR